MPYISHGKLVIQYSAPYLNLPDTVHEEFVQLWKKKIFLLQTDSSEINQFLRHIYRKIQKIISKPISSADQRKTLADLFTNYIECVRKIVADSYFQHPKWSCPICTIRNPKTPKTPKTHLISILGYDKQLKQLGQPQYQPGFVGVAIDNHWGAELILQAIQYCSQRFLDHS